MWVDPEDEYCEYVASLAAWLPGGVVVGWWGGQTPLMKAAQNGWYANHLHVHVHVRVTLSAIAMCNARFVSPSLAPSLAARWAGRRQSPCYSATAPTPG